MSDRDNILLDLWTRWGGIEGLVAAQRAESVTADELATAARTAIAAHNADLAALTTVLDPGIRSATGSTALAGIPFVAKENMAVAGLVTTAGAAWLTGTPAAPEHAGVVSAALGAGALLVGRGNMPELASAAVTIGDPLGPARSPLEKTRTAGGSSGGTAAAVAAGLVLFGIGSDTGGSVTIPAACTGILGYRPTPGVLPTSGIVPFAPTFDTPGLLCRTAADLAHVHRALVPGPVGTMPVDRLTVGVVGGMFDDELDDAVRDGRERLVDALGRAGATVRPIYVPTSAELFPAIRTIAWYEAARAWTPLADALPAHPPSDSVRVRIDHGRAIPHQLYLEALAERDRWIRVLHNIFEQVDIVLSPTLSGPPPRIDELDVERDTVRLTRLTYPWCFGGLPSVSIPVGDTAAVRRTSFPAIGIQLTGTAGADRLLIEVAAELERAAQR